jgi:hypothetical protein
MDLHELEMIVNAFSAAEIAPKSQNGPSDSEIYRAGAHVVRQACHASDWSFVCRHSDLRISTRWVCLHPSPTHLECRRVRSTTAYEWSAPPRPNGEHTPCQDTKNWDEEATEDELVDITETEEFHHLLDEETVTR